MKLKNVIIYNSESAVKKLKNTDLPIRTVYKLNKTLKTITEKIAFIEQTKDEIIKKYGQLNEQGIPFIDGKDIENIEKFINDFNEVLEIEEDIEFEKLSLDELEGVILSSAELESIVWLIEEGE